MFRGGARTGEHLQRSPLAPPSSHCLPQRRHNDKRTKAGDGRRDSAYIEAVHAASSCARPAPHGAASARTTSFTSRAGAVLLTEIPAGTLPARDDAGVAASGTLPLDGGRRIGQTHSYPSRAPPMRRPAPASDFRKTPGPRRLRCCSAHDFAEISTYFPGSSLRESTVGAKEMLYIRYPHLRLLSKPLHWFILLPREAPRDLDALLQEEGPSEGEHLFAYLNERGEGPRRTTSTQRLALGLFTTLRGS